MILWTCLSSVGQLPIKFVSVEQAATTPDEDGELYFMSFFYSRPVNVTFDGKTIIMTYKNGVTYLKKSVKSYEKTDNYDDGKLIESYVLNVSTDSIKTRYGEIMIIIDHRFRVLNRQVIVPTKDVYGENYTCFRRFAKGY